MREEWITSRKNPLLVQIRRLASSRGARRSAGMFLGDGVKLLEEALKWGAPLETVVYSEGLDGPELPPEVRTVRVPEDVMASISPMESPQGALFLCRMWDTAPPPRLEGGRYLVLDGLQDPGNVGTIWRTADALEADGLLLVHGCADPFGPKVVRATMGACFRLPVWETGYRPAGGYGGYQNGGPEPVRRGDRERGARGLAGTARYEPAGPEDPYAGAV